MNALIAQSLERAGEQGGDLSAAIYAEFFRRAPQAKQLMTHIDAHVQGRMLAEVFEWLMTPPDALPTDVIAFETRNHIQAYSVDLAMYQPLFAAVATVVQAHCDDQWTTEIEAAWQQQTAALEDCVRRATATGA